jgi:hypothetical protein
MKDKNKNSLARKPPKKEQIFKELIGCVTTPLEEKVTPEMIKSIWKNHPLDFNGNLFEGVSPFTDEELKEEKKSLFPNE